MKFELFDAVELKESATLSEGQLVPAGVQGAIVEVFDQGDAYLVELFGGWVKIDQQGDRALAQQQEPGAFVETLGVALLYSQQLRLVQPAQTTVGDRVRLYNALEELSENLVKEVADFAEFLQQKARQQSAIRSHSDKSREFGPSAVSASSRRAESV